MSPAVDNYILDAAPEWQPILSELRYMILQLTPAIEESIKWKVPFYSYNGLLCYLNVRKKEVDIGFYHGAKLPNANGLLVGNGKLVRHIKIKSFAEIEAKRAAILEIFQEAILWNEAND